MKFTEVSFARFVVFTAAVEVGLDESRVDGESRLSDVVKSAADSWRSPS